MIGSLRGRVGGRSGSTLLVDVGGVGYVVHASLQTLQTAGDVGEEVFLLVHTQVREDAISLFGFQEAEERDLFLMLLGVQGVGPKVALALLSVRSVRDLLDALASGDKTLLCMADGVGAKLAARLVTELQSKAVAAGGRETGAVGAVVLKSTKGGGQAGDDARQALQSLGYDKRESEQLVAHVLSQPDPPTDTPSIIQASLRAAHVRA